MTIKQSTLLNSHWLFSGTLLFVLSATSSYAAAPNIGGCDIFPADNVWNTPINTLSVHQNSSVWVGSIGAGTGLHMDFGSATWNGMEVGIPFNVIQASKEPKQTFNFLYHDESDVGLYPVNASFKIESGSDHHLISLDTETCRLYEIFNARNDKGWQGDSGAIFDLKSNAFRPIGWTSADAAGLPILPGLVRYDEVLAGEIKHAIRFTMQKTNSYIWPATHLTSGKANILTNQPPMGARFRLKADYDISQFDPKLQVILKAMKQYGIINADNGANWFIGGAPDPRWDDDLLAKLSKIKGNAFEAVDESCMMVSADSGQADLSKCNATPKDRVPNNNAAAASNASIPSAPKISGCQLFPADNIWNTPIDALPIHPYSSKWVANIGGGGTFHTDFASGKWQGLEIGIPFNLVNAKKDPKYSFNFLYGEESDAGPYPIAADSRVEEGADHHLISVDNQACKLYEIFNAQKTSGGWTGDSGAIFDLKSNAMRPIGYTSADAAGLPILPGLVRYDEVAAGVINHAIRFTAEKTRGYLWPGTHLTSGKAGEVYDFQPPLGARFRMKADYDISSFDPKLQVIFKAMKTYGIILADNGANWYLSGVPDSRWDDDMLASIERLRGSAFEAVDESCLMVNANSYQVNLSKCGIVSRDRVLTESPVNPNACNYTLSIDTQKYTAAGGIDSVTVNVTGSNPQNCNWSAKSNTAWLPIYVQTLQGAKRVIFAVARNKTGENRTGTITIANKTFTVEQAK